MLLSLALLMSPLAASAMPVAQGWQLPDSEVTTLTAADGHDYHVLVAWPDGEPPPEGWPVLVILDGKDNFAVAVMTARRLARAGARSGVEPGIIVGIDSGGLARRVLDYTPPVKGYAIPQGAPAHGLEIGGGDRFLKFIRDQLRPWVDRRWRTNSERQTFAGHSFGGLLVLHSMFDDGFGFTRYAAVSPSLWYGDALLEREERAFTGSNRSALFLAIGQRETGPDGHSGAAAEALVQRLSAKSVRARFLSLSGQGHDTSLIGAMGDIVTLAFGKDQR